MISDNTHRVGIFQADRRDYSLDWIDVDHFWEKESLRSLSHLVSDGDNFLRYVIKPGDRVVIKPNWVSDNHIYGYDIFSTITHPAMLRAVIDLTHEALDGKGQIIIADSPQWDCDFNKLLALSKIPQLCDYYWRKLHFRVQVRDLRQVCCLSHEDYIKSSDRIQLPGDPEGYAVVDMGLDSAFEGMPHVELLYGADYDRQETIKHHNAKRHEYLLSKTILGSDVVIHVPKYKVHKKVGVTLNGKGMVGINGNKNWVAHYRIGSPSQGGDEFPDNEPASAKRKARAVRFLIDRLIASKLPFGEEIFDSLRSTYKRIKPLLGLSNSPRLSVEAGNWFGNDTAWRMTADLARIVIYADCEGKIQNSPQRRFFSVIDGIISGEKEGPLAPTPKHCGVLLAGDNLLAVDIVGTRLMGFDWQKVKYLRWLVERHPILMSIKHPQSDIEIRSNISSWDSLMINYETPDLNFEPHPGWKGHIEITRPFVNIN